MHLPTKVSVALGAVAAVVAATLSTASSSTTAHTQQAPASGGGRTAEPLYTFVAAPDFLNQDVGDVRTLPTWHEGDPNSWTPQLEESIDTFLDEIQAQHPQSVLVSGDLVEGHWFDDIDKTGIFGPSGTDEQKSAMLRRAASFYHRTYLERFTDRGLTLHAALGDHDIGDNSWHRSFKRQNVPALKRVFGTYYTRTPSGADRYANHPEGTPWDRTAYAVRLAPQVLLVTVDVFHLTRDNVEPEVVGGQLRWLRHTLERAQAKKTTWVIVQGHDPIATPVRTRSSSGVSVEEGTSSRLWRTMSHHGVDLYLAGEVHDTTMRQSDGVTQISTGGLLYAGQATYMTATVYADRIEFDVREFDHVEDGPATDTLWQLGVHDTVGNRRLLPGSHSVGSLTLATDGTAVTSSGKLAPYDG